MRRYFAGFGDDLPPSRTVTRGCSRKVEYPLILAALTATSGHQIKGRRLLWAFNRKTPLRKETSPRAFGVNRLPFPYALPDPAKSAPLRI